MNIREIQRVSRYILRNYRRFTSVLQQRHIIFLGNISKANSLTTKQIEYFFIIRDEILIGNLKQQMKAMIDFVENLQIRNEKTEQK